MRYRKLALLLLVALGGCTAVSRSPPLSTRLANDRWHYDAVYLSSGTFARPHTILGVMQVTIEGYRWLHEVELNPDTDPNSILWRIAALARDHRADGIQKLSLIDENPQTPADKVVNQVNTAIHVDEQLRSGRPPTALTEGTETRYHAQGELVRFAASEGAP
jgi:hypothetical protein